MLAMTSVISGSVGFVMEFPRSNSLKGVTVHFLLASFFVVSSVATIEWIYLKARKAVTWTSDPNRWDTFAGCPILARPLRKGGIPRKCPAWDFSRRSLKKLGWWKPRLIFFKKRAGKNTDEGTYEVSSHPAQDRAKAGRHAPIAL
jgi:hypothetical protein